MCTKRRGPTIKNQTLSKCFFFNLDIQFFLNLDIQSIDQLI